MKRLVAIVDDDESVRDALTNLMSSHGYDVVGYASAEDFVDSVDRGRTACLISDVNMPGMSGFEMYDALINLGERIPTIFVTAYANEAERKQAREMQECYLTKPFSEQELLTCVRSALDRSRS